MIDNLGKGGNYMQPKERTKLKEKIKKINHALTDSDTQKIMDLLEKEVEKTEKQMMITLEIKEMLEDWLEDQYDEDDPDSIIH